MIRVKIDDTRMYAIIEENIDFNHEDICQLIKIQNMFITNNCKRLYIEFTECKYINAAVSVIIGTFPEYAKKIGKSVKYRFSNQPENPIFIFMKNVGMYKYYTKNIVGYTGIDVIPFNQIINEKMMDEYADRIMTLAPIKMQKEARDILTSYILEIYQNGYFHSKSEIGVFTSGIWIKEKKEFVFSIYDMGIGIPENIRNHGFNKIDSEKCMKIAFIDGFSTLSRPDINRGLGLTRLEKFAYLNNGNVSIYTDNICCIISGEENKKEYKYLDYSIKGTLIIMKIAVDENHIYIIERENKHE